MNQTTFNIGGVPEHFNLPWYLALERQLFDNENITLNWTDYPGGTGAMAAALRNGDLDIAVLLTEGIVADIVKGNPSKIIQVYVKSPLLWGIHVPAQSDIHSVDDLEGKRFAISRIGSGSHLMAFVDATQRDWNPEELELVLVGDINGAREAFKNNQADGFMWEKFMTKPLVDAGEFRRVGETPTPWPCFVIAAREEVIQNNPEALKKILEVINKAAENFMANKENSLSLITDRFNLKPEDAATWFAATCWNTGETVDEEMVQQVLDSLYSLKIIPTKPEPKTLIAKL